MQPTSIPPQAVQRVLDVVDAYIQEFHPPLAQPFLQQVFETAIPQLNDLKLNALQGQQVLQEAMRLFNPTVALSKVVPPQTKAIASQVDQLIKTFQAGPDVSQVLDVLDAYIQQTKPPLSRTFLYPIVSTIIPQLPNLNLDQKGIERLANQAMLKFIPEIALSKVLSPNSRAIASEVIKQIQHFAPEQAMMGIANLVDAQLQAKMTPTEKVLYQLAKMVLSQVIDLPFNKSNTQQLATQVTFQFSSPAAPLKSPELMAQEIAAQLDSEITQMRASRAQQLGTADITKATVLGDLEVGINIIKTSNP